MTARSPAIAMASHIELWPIDRLIPYQRNARTHSDEQIAKICASIRQFGFNAPILADEHDGIIAGHGRLTAAQLLGLPEVPVIPLTHLTDAQRRAYILADNRLAEDAGWDDALLAEELAGLQDDGFDLLLTGFDSDELEKLLAADVDDGEPDDPADSAGEEKTKPLGIMLTAEQAVTVWQAIGAAKGLGKFDGVPEEQLNAAAITFVCEMFVTKIAGVHG